MRRIRPGADRTEASERRIASVTWGIISAARCWRGGLVALQEADVGGDAVGESRTPPSPAPPQPPPAAGAGSPRVARPRIGGRPPARSAIGRVVGVADDHLVPEGVRPVQEARQAVAGRRTRRPGGRCGRTSTRTARPAPGPRGRRRPGAPLRPPPGSTSSLPVFRSMMRTGRQRRVAHSGPAGAGAAGGSRAPARPARRAAPAAATGRAGPKGAAGIRGLSTTVSPVSPRRVNCSRRSSLKAELHALTGPAVGQHAPGAARGRDPGRSAAAPGARNAGARRCSSR